MSIPESNGKTVLITGINGYIASVLGLLVLSKGYSLRGTTRRVASAEPLLTGPYAAYKDRLEIFEVSDMTVDGAFDEAAKGVDGIFHTASPINFSLDFDKMVIPAIRGSETLLESALKAGSQLKAVVVTSSVAAIIDPPKTPDHIYTEAEFATVNLDRATRERGSSAQTPGNVLYPASKTAADRAVWKFRTERKPFFSISTINPSVVCGPPINVSSSGDKLNETLRPLYTILAGTSSAMPPSIGSGSFVDVRDVGTMHLWALENASKTDGERYIACAGFGPPQAAADILSFKYKGVKIGEKIIEGKPGDGYFGFNGGNVEDVVYPPGRVQVSGKKAERDMSIKYISFKKSVLDTAKVLEKLL